MGEHLWLKSVSNCCRWCSSTSMKEPCVCCAGCYFAAESKFNLEHYLIDYGLLTG